jgi:hypothetical protein
VNGASVDSTILVTTPVQTAPGVAVPWQPYSLFLHMNEKALLAILGQQVTALAGVPLKSRMAVAQARV